MLNNTVTTTFLDGLTKHYSRTLEIPATNKTNQIKALIFFNLIVFTEVSFSDIHLEGLTNLPQYSSTSLRFATDGVANVGLSDR